MKATQCIIDRSVQAQLDRLIAGELPPSERRSLLAWLDEDVRRWRACAVAFLEAQSWEEAAGEANLTLARSASEGNSPSAAFTLPRRKSSLMPAVAIAASIAIAFAAGIFAARLSPGLMTTPSEEPVRLAHEGPTANAPDQPLVATVSVRTNLEPSVPAQLKLPVAPASSQQAAASSLSDYEREQWERSGFEVHEERRYLPARLQDGREIMVPVNKVQLKLKPAPVS
jgi:hypothetical protein